MTSTALISKFFRIGTSGPTVDGRDISAQDIDDMAASYDLEEYTASINIEHLNSLSAFGQFPTLGKVIALKAETDKKNRRVLLAQIEPSAEMIYVNSQKQKLFTSMEIAKNFAKTGKAYLVGLAVTDRPASLGVEALCFSAKNGGPTDTRFKDNFFTPHMETETFAMAEDTAPSTPSKPDANDPSTPNDDSPKKTFADKFSEIFKPAQKKTEDHLSQMEEASLTLAKKVSTMESDFSDLKKANAELSKTVEAQEAQIAEFKTALENTPEDNAPEGSSRPKATGEAVNLTDC